MKKILITGAGGFIGRNLKEQLEEHYQVLTPDKSELDLCDTSLVRSYLDKHHFDVIVHAANYGTADTSKPDPYKILNYGLRMFYNLAKCHDLYDKMLYFGSGAEFDVRHYIYERRIFGDIYSGGCVWPVQIFNRAVFGYVSEYL